MEFLKYNEFVNEAKSRLGKATYIDEDGKVIPITIIDHSRKEYHIMFKDNKKKWVSKHDVDIDESANGLELVSEKIARAGKNKYKIKDIDFDEIKKLSKKSEGIIFLGAGGNLAEWVNGINDVWDAEGLASKAGPIEDKIEDLYTTETTGGRTDLIMVFKKKTTLQIGKLAMWRIKFGDASWLSDYVDNYASHHGVEESINESEDYAGYSISDIAMVVHDDWKKVNYAAKPYLDAMGDLESIEDNYFLDSGKSIVAYFLSNASGWRGRIAKDIKRELKNRLK